MPHVLVCRLRIHFAPPSQFGSACLRSNRRWLQASPTGTAQQATRTKYIRKFSTMHRPNVSHRWTEDLVGKAMVVLAVAVTIILTIANSKQVRVRTYRLRVRRAPTKAPLGAKRTGVSRAPRMLKMHIRLHDRGVLPGNE